MRRYKDELRQKLEHQQSCLDQIEVNEEKQNKIFKLGSELKGLTEKSNGLQEALSIERIEKENTRIRAECRGLELENLAAFLIKSLRTIYFAAAEEAKLRSRLQNAETTNV